MKKKILAVLMMLVLTGTLAGCAKDPSEMKYLKDFDVNKYVTLGEYKGVTISLDEPTVSDEYMQTYIDYILQSSPVLKPITDRDTVETGDITVIDYEGKMDGVAFEGGTAQGANLQIGSGQFIPGFEDGMIGMKVGETKDVEVTFPDPYDNNPDMAGKPAVFTVTVHSINTQETPELTDEFVTGLGMEEFKTVEEFNTFVYDFLLSQQQEQYEATKQDFLIAQVESQATIKDAPEGVITRMNDMMTQNISSYAQMNGTDIGTYVAQTYGGSADSYQVILREQASKMAKRYMLLQAISEKEGLTMTDEEMEAQIAQEATDYGYATVDEYKANMDVDGYKEYLMTQKVMGFLSENANITPTTADTTAPAEETAPAE